MILIWFECLLHVLGFFRSHKCCKITSLEPHYNSKVAKRCPPCQHPCCSPLKGCPLGLKSLVPGTEESSALIKRYALPGCLQRGVEKKKMQKEMTVTNMKRSISVSVLRGPTEETRLSYQHGTESPKPPDQCQYLGQIRLGVKAMDGDGKGEGGHAVIKNIYSWTSGFSHVEFPLSRSSFFFFLFLFSSSSSRTLRVAKSFR